MDGCRILPTHGQSGIGAHNFSVFCWNGNENELYWAVYTHVLVHMARGLGLPLVFVVTVILVKLYGGCELLAAGIRSEVIKVVLRSLNFYPENEPFPESGPLCRRIHSRSRWYCTSNHACSHWLSMSVSLNYETWGEGKPHTLCTVELDSCFWDWSLRGSE